MIDREHKLPIQHQAKVLKISRSSVYYAPRPVSEADLMLMRRIDKLHLNYPFAGSRMLRDMLSREGLEVGRRHVRTLMRKMAIEAVRLAAGHLNWVHPLAGFKKVMKTDGPSVMGPRIL